MLRFLSLAIAEINDFWTEICAPSKSVNYSSFNNIDFDAVGLHEIDLFFKFNSSVRNTNAESSTFEVLIRLFKDKSEYFNAYENIVRIY